MSSTKNSLPMMARQLVGTEPINTTRLLILKSWKADINNNAVDRLWIIPKANRRTYLQHKISLHQLKIWHTFPTIRETLTLILPNPPGGPPTTTYNIFPGNWSPDSLAAYLTHILTDSITVTYDPYQLKFNFCPNITINEYSTLLPYLGFPSGEPVEASQASEFPPYLLYGPTEIQVWTNFTMNSIPYSEYLCSVPISQYTYGQHINFTNFDNSMASLSLDADIREVRVVLKDENDNLLSYPEELPWEVILALEAVQPEGFVPLEA